MNKAELIEYIKDKDSFYLFANLSEHTLEQLIALKERIDRRQEGKNTDGHKK